MKLGITAVTGQLGRAIAKEAIATLGPDAVIGTSRSPDKAADLGIQVFEADYNDPSGFEAAFQGVDSVLLVSGFDAPDKRLKQHQNVIHAAKAAGANKIVYTSVLGPETEALFSTIVKSNRQTERDIKESGLEFAIGRNGIYIEPDIESLDEYVKAGKISNSAGDGLCAYTTRSELAAAYVALLTSDKHNGQTFNLCGPPLSQQQLVDHLNETFGQSLRYEALSVDAYYADRKAQFGEFFGEVIGGIYHGIHEGAFAVRSDFEAAAGRPHMTWDAYFAGLRSR